MTPDPRELEAPDDIEWYVPMRLSDRKRRRGMVAVDLADVQARYDRYYATLAFYVVLRKYLQALTDGGR
jgi:hypothetical protein